MPIPMRMAVEKSPLDGRYDSSLGLVSPGRDCSRQRQLGFSCEHASPAPDESTDEQRYPRVRFDESPERG